MQYCNEKVRCFVQRRNTYTKRPNPIIEKLISGESLNYLFNDG